VGKKKKFKIDMKSLKKSAENIKKDINDNLSSFDILWFDLETKVRNLIVGLTQPLNDHIFGTRDQLKVVQDDLQKESQKLKDIQRIVLNETEEMDVFKDIFKRISDLDIDRKSIEKGLKNEMDQVNKAFEEYGFKFANNEKLIDSMKNSVEALQLQLLDLRDQVQTENERFVVRVRDINQDYMDDQKKLRERLNEMDERTLKE
jgi:hypothetical protein